MTNDEKRIVEWLESLSQEAQKRKKNTVAHAYAFAARSIRIGDHRKD